MTNTEFIDEINLLAMKHSDDMSPELLQDMLALVKRVRHGVEPLTEYEQYIESSIRG